MHTSVRRRSAAVLACLALSASPLVAGTAQAAPDPFPDPSGTADDVHVDGPIPGAVPGDRLAPDVADTYPFFSTDDDLARAGYVEQEFTVSGTADAWAPDGTRVAEEVAYDTRVIVRRPASPAHANGVVLLEWQNVTAGYDLDALWNAEQLTRDGYTWVGVSAQRVGVEHLQGWSPARYGHLDVTGGGAFSADELSYEIFADAARAARDTSRHGVLGGIEADTVLALGASQSAGRMKVYYDEILPQTEPVIDGYAFVVGDAPEREGDEPVFHVLSETDVLLPGFVRTDRPDSATYRRWDVAGSAHSGWQGQAYRASISERDLTGGAPEYECTAEPFSRVPLHYVTTRAYAHLARWVDGAPPPVAPRLERVGTDVARNELGLATGDIQLSQVAVPTAVGTGRNSGESFCLLFGSHRPFSPDELADLYPRHGGYVSQVARVGAENVRAGFIDHRDARHDTRTAARGPR